MKKVKEGPAIVEEGEHYLMVKLPDTRILAIERKNLHIIIEFCKKFNCELTEVEATEKTAIYNMEEFAKIANSISTPRMFDRNKLVKVIIKSNGDISTSSQIQSTTTSDFSISTKKSTPKEIRAFIWQSLSDSAFIPENYIMTKFPDRKYTSLVEILETYVERLNDNPEDIFMYKYEAGKGITKTPRNNPVTVSTKPNIEDIPDWMSSYVRKKSTKPNASPNQSYERWLKLKKNNKLKFKPKYDIPSGDSSYFD